jgi:hypothetical protein
LNNGIPWFIKRISELALSNGQSKHAILFNDVLLLPEGGLQITIHSSKIDQNKNGPIIGGRTAR